jgi:hypothetical protein
VARAEQRRRFPVGANLTRQPLQPEAIGAVMEVTKWLKPSISVSRLPTSYRSNIDEGVVPAPKYLHCQTRLLNDRRLVDHKSGN